MCEPRYFRTAVPANQQAGSIPLDVYTFQLVLTPNQERNKAAGITVDLEDAQLLMSFDFHDDELLIIETQISVRVGSEPRLDHTITTELRDEISHNVQQYGDIVPIRNQIDAYLDNLSTVFETCFGRDPSDPECRKAIELFNAVQVT